MQPGRIDSGDRCAAIGDLAEGRPEVNALEVLRRLPGDFRAKLSSISPESEIQLSFVLEFGRQTPPISFSAETIQLLASHGASLDIDT